MVLPQTNFHNRHSHTMEIECSSVWCGCEWNEDAAHTHIAEQKALVSIHCLFTHTHTQLKHNFVKQKNKIERWGWILFVVESRVILCAPAKCIRSKIPTCARFAPPFIRTHTTHTSLVFGCSIYTTCGYYGMMMMMNNVYAWQNDENTSYLAEWMKLYRSFDSILIIPAFETISSV